MSERENYFLLLGLSFDPIEEDPQVIEQAIKEKTIQWQKEAKNPKKQAAVKEKLANIPKMKQIMLDPASREKEARNALTIKAAKIRDVKNELTIMQLKGYITPNEIEKLLKRHSKNGITEENIMEIISVPIENAPIVELGENAIVLDKNSISQIETYFDNLGIDNYSIYDYLNASEKEVSMLCSQRLKTLLEKGNKANSDEVEQKLLGLFVMIFDNPQLIEGYNNFLSGCQYRKINDLIKIGVNTGMSPDVVATLIQICQSDFAISEKYAMVYIVNNIRINKYDVDIENIKKQKNNIQQQMQPIVPIKTKEEEKAEMRERILEEQRIKNEIEEERKRKEEEERKEQEKIERERDKARKDYMRIIDEIKEANEKQKEAIDDLSNTMTEHKAKREKNALVPSKGIMITNIVCFGIALSFFSYSFFAFGNPKDSTVSAISLAAVAVSFVVAAFYFYVYKKWEKTVLTIQKTLDKKDEYEKKNREIVEISEQHEFFTDDARNDLIQYEKSRNQTYNEFITGYNNFVKFNNKAKYNRDMSKIVIIAIICAIVGIAAQFILGGNLKLKF